MSAPATCWPKWPAPGLPRLEGCVLWLGPPALLWCPSCPVERLEAHQHYNLAAAMPLALEREAHQIVATHRDAQLFLA